MSVKFKESTQWYNLFYMAKAIATVVYSQKMTTNRDSFNKYERYIVQGLLRHTQLDNCNHV